MWPIIIYFISFCFLRLLDRSSTRSLYQVKLTPDPQYIGNVLNPIFHSHSTPSPLTSSSFFNTLLPAKLLNVWFCFLFLTSAAALLFLIFIVYNDHPFATRRPRLDHVLLLRSACRLQRSILCTRRSSCRRSHTSKVSLNKSSPRSSSRWSP